MRAFIFFVATLALVLAVSATPEEEKKNIPVIHGYEQGKPCPAKYFRDDCNYCFCSEDGFNAGCTKMACPDQKLRIFDPEYPVVHGYQEGQACPAPTFKDDCNICVCGEDGYSAACTKMYCHPQARIFSPEYPVVHGYQQGEACPARTFKDDCNICICSDDGHSAACTKMYCHPQKRIFSPEYPTVHGYQQGQECPARTFKNDCNICLCNEDGVSARCADAYCHPQ